MLLHRWMKSLIGTSARSPRRASAPAPRPKFWAEILEDRTVLAANFATGAALGEVGIVRVYDGSTQAQVAAFLAYDPAFTGGVNVAMGDVTGDGTADIITGTASGADHVKVFDGVTFQEVRSFLAFGGFPGGVNVAAGDIDGDGKADVVASVASGGSPHVKAFSGADNSELASFFAYDQAFVGGVRIAVGDVDGDGKADIVTGTGPGASGHVKVFSGQDNSLLRSFIAYDGFNGGINVGVGDLDGDGKADIVTGTSSGPAHVKTFDGASGAQEGSFIAFEGFTGGVLVGVSADTNGNGTGELSIGANGTAHVKVFDGNTQAELSSTLVPDGKLSGGFVQTPVGNSTPVLAAVGDRTGAALSALTFTVSATDPNLTDVLSYSATGLPTGATFDPTTRTFAWTPTLVQTGPFTVTFSVTDGEATASETVTITISPTNVAPVITSNGGGATGSTSTAENGTAVTTVTATDANSGDTLTYSIVGGADMALFTINSSTGALAFASGRNFESPADEGLDNVYDVTVQVSDGTLSDTQSISVTVTDVNESPSITSSATANAAENQTAALTVTGTDPDAGATLTYSITGGADMALFTINGSTGAVTFNSAPNFESPADSGANNVYNIVVQVSDGTNSTTQSISVTVTDVNESPSITSSATANAAENQTAALTVTGTDPDAGATLTYSITGGADMALFTINGSTGAVTFNSAPDFETPTDTGANNVYNITVQVSDGSLSTTQNVAITVTGTNDNSPTITSNGGGATGSASVGENGTAVTTVTATDADAGTTLTYSISSGADMGLFTINSSTGALAFASAPNFEVPTDNGTDNVYDVVVQVSDGTNTDTQAMAITVTDVNESPSITSSATANAAENQTAALTVTGTDPDAGATLTYSITGGADVSLFTINGSTGAVTFNSAPNFESPADSGANNVYNIVVQVSDGTNSTTQNVAVTVTDVNESPSITSSATANAAENQTAALTVTGTDPDAGATLTYSITGGADMGLFTINGSTGALAFNSAPNFETPTDSGANNVYNITVQVSDGTNSTTQNVAITVTDANDAPVVTASAGTTSYTVGDPGAIIDGSITVTDVDSGDMMAGATVGSADFAVGDVLAFDSALATGFGISGSFDGVTTGVLTLTGSATAAQYQAVLQTVTFATSVNVTATLTFTFSVDDGLASHGSNKDVSVTSI